jgi:plastocyanin
MMTATGLLRKVLAMLVFIIVVAGCASPELPGPQTYTVEIAQMKFNPAEITVHKGDTIIFVNRDLVTHNIVEETGTTWASSSLPQGASWSMTATQSAGYFCALHPVMKGKIVVQ